MAKGATRRRVMQTAAGAALFSTRMSTGQITPGSSLLRVQHQPDLVEVYVETGTVSLQKNGSKWQGAGIELNIEEQAEQTNIRLRAADVPLLRIHLRWHLTPAANLLYLGDHWERSYGDLAWRYLEPERPLPWYFLAFDGKTTFACGVKTAPAALCFWQVDPRGVSLWLDVRNGGRGAKLEGRAIDLASCVTESHAGETPFAAARTFCSRLCKQPRMPRQPVYGGNNWYYAYGKSSANDMRDDSKRIASLASSETNRPFMVIDDGWTPNSTAGPWRANAQFSDMARLASDMHEIGVRPGLWLRPLFTKESVKQSWQLISPNAAREYRTTQAYTLDPTVPEALKHIQSDFEAAAGWGYELLKHDFSTYDLLGRWGMQMGATITDDNWNFADRTRTNAEIILDFYRALRQAAGDTLLLGCNTIGHLGAGVFELQRVGDDTSGRDWNRTRKMGVNTLAFRIAQHGTFFAVDADCVGLTRDIPWTLNRQWLDLLARSGTPLFVSVAPDALGEEQRAALKRAFSAAAKSGELGQPLDWLHNSEPERWKLAGGDAHFDWFGSEGVSPFVS